MTWPEDSQSRQLDKVPRPGLRYHPGGVEYLGSSSSGSMEQEDLNPPGNMEGMESMKGQERPKALRDPRLGGGGKDRRAADRHPQQTYSADRNPLQAPTAQPGQPPRGNIMRPSWQGAPAGRER